MTTKEKIIFESLKLFSDKGYDGVSMREIAAAVGIKGSSIYNHFKGKEEIFKAIFDEMKKRYDNAAISIGILMKEDDKTTNLYSNIDENKLLKMVTDLFYLICNDEFIVMFRKLLISEQHKSAIASSMLKLYYIDSPIIFQTKLFEKLQKQGNFLEYDPSAMALHFYTPIYFVLAKNDLGTPYDECLKIIKNHVHGFCQLYAK